MGDDRRTRIAPAERFATEVTRFDLMAEARALDAEPASPSHGHRQKALYRHGPTTVALFSLEPGGALPDHAVQGMVTIQCVDGRIQVHEGSTTHELGPGTLVALAPAQVHDVRAVDKSVMLLHVSLEK